MKKHIIPFAMPFPVLLLFTLLFSGHSVLANEKSFLDGIKKTVKPFDTETVKKVRPVIRKTVLALEEYHGRSFQVLARKQEIERYKCSNCHGEKPVLVKQGFELTHGDVIINHGRAGNELSCIDCHSEEDRDYLEDKKGRKIDFDHSYKLCGQCHFRQKRDWLGGAHGKRVSNWAGERIVYNCASCHNPHSPRFSKRFPATYSVPLN